MEIGFIYAIGAAIAWGIVYTIDQKILYDLPPMIFLFIGAVLSSLMILPFVLFGDSSIKKIITNPEINWGLIFLTTAIGTLAGFFIFSAIKTLDASTASVIEISYPFFVILFSYIFFKTTHNIYFFIGAIFLFIGSVIIIKLG